MESIYQMFMRLGGAGFFVRRGSWSNPRAAARVISVGGETSASLSGKPLDHTVGSHRANPKVIAAVSYYGEPAWIGELTSPETYAYVLIERPDGWKELATNEAVNAPGPSASPPSGRIGAFGETASSDLER